MPRKPSSAGILEVQGRGNFDVFKELFAVVDHTPQPGFTPDRDGARSLYRALRAAFTKRRLLTI
jgi:hypothetical protein